MNTETADRVFALAGMLQCAHLVDRIAHTGMVGQQEFTTCVRTLFAFSPEDTLAVYGGLRELRTGLRLAGDLFVRLNLSEHALPLRYVLELEARERRAARDEALMQRLRGELEQIGSVFDVEGAYLDVPCLEALAALYESTVGSLTPRIQVLGERHHLQRHENIVRVRVLLLAGFRSAVLWRQVGGRRWRVLFGFSAMREAVVTSNDMLKASESQPS